MMEKMLRSLLERFLPTWSPLMYKATLIGMVVAETLGLPLDGVQVNIGRNAHPPGGASGGSTTVVAPTRAAA